MIAKLIPCASSGGLLRYLHEGRAGEGGDDTAGTGPAGGGSGKNGKPEPDRNAGGDVIPWRAVEARWAADRRAMYALDGRNRGGHRTGKNCEERQAYHLILAPDPNQPTDKDTLYVAAQRITEDFTVAMTERPHDYHIVLHDEGAGLHAHVALSAVNGLGTGKLRLSRTYAKELRDVKEAVCMDMGIAVANDPGPQRAQKARDPMGERQARLKGQTIWKARLKDTLDRVVLGSIAAHRSPEQTRAAMKAAKLEYDPSHKTWIDADGHRIRARSLGAGYTLEGLQARAAAAFAAMQTQAQPKASKQQGREIEL